MSEERTYPREWFKAARWGDEPFAKTFVRETEFMLFYAGHQGREERTSKSDSYSTWYPTREKAEAVIAARKERQDAANAVERIRNAAPELLEALEKIAEETSKRQLPLTCLINDLATAAIAKARS